MFLKGSRYDFFNYFQCGPVPRSNLINFCCNKLIQWEKLSKYQNGSEAYNRFLPSLWTACECEWPAYVPLPLLLNLETRTSLDHKCARLQSFNKNGGVAQMVERSLSMREVPGSIPGASNIVFNCHMNLLTYSFIIFNFWFVQNCDLGHRIIWMRLLLMHYLNYRICEDKFEFLSTNFMRNWHMILFFFRPPMSQTHSQKVKYSFCVFCKNNGEDEAFYLGHTLKDDNGRVTCPILFNYR